MKSLGSILLEKEILLESGTNEVEILVFRVGSFLLGVNVAKVREVLPRQAITRLPEAHASIVGCFRLRDTVVPCVSLRRHLRQPENEGDEGRIILTEFNQTQIAFMVDEVQRIHRVSWNRVLAAPTLVTDSASPVTAVTNLDGKLVIMLDFEMISAEVASEVQVASAVPNPRGLPRESFRLLLADDSATVRKAVETTLKNSGYSQVRSFENGRQAWEYIQERFSRTQDVRQVADLLISDVEMPFVDGLHLTRNIKEHASLKALPVLLFSSILTPDNHKKGQAVGADAQITKPELGRVVELADELLSRARGGAAAPALAT